MKKKTALRLVTEELDRAISQYGEFNNCHEGYAVLLEEVDELWTEIKGNQGSSHRGVSEAVQIAAMALRYLVDLCEESTAVQHDNKAKRQSYNPLPSSKWRGYSG